MRVIRYDYVDMTKGFAIISVVLGHLGILTEYFYLFHMPLFFFVSGIFFKPRNHTFKEYCLLNFNSLIKPYIVYLILLYPMQVYHQYGTFNLGNEWKIVIARFFLGGRFLSGFVTVFWFITVLFFNKIIFFKLNDKYSSKQVFFIVLLFLVMGYLNQFFFNSLRLPFDLNVVFFSVPIFYIGYHFKTLKFALGIKRLAFLFIILGIIGVAYYGDLVSMDLKNTDYGLPLLSLFSSIGITIILLLFFKRVDDNYFFSFFKELGKASLVIMYLHQVIKWCYSYMNFTNNIYIIAVLTIITCYLFYKLFKCFSVTRIFLLGEKR